MEKETATQKKCPLTTNELQADDVKAKQEPQISEKSPTTPVLGGSWGSWGGWIAQAKEKSASVLEAVKADLNEITTAVTETFHIMDDQQEETLPLSRTDNIPSESSTAVNYMKQSISSFFGQVTDALIPQLDDDDTEAVLISSSDAVTLTGYAKHLAELQANEETYLEEPSKTDELAEKYRMWLEVVEQDQFTQQRISRMLESSQILNEKYNKYVPDTVTHMNFFKRYLFKKALLEDELANAERKPKEIIIVTEPGPVIVEPEIQVAPTTKTDVEGMEIAHFELSEEEQARLLEDYEQEIKERQNTKKDSIDVPTEAPPKAKMSKVKMAQSKTSVTANSAKGKNNKSVKFQQQQKSTQQHPESREMSQEETELKIKKDHFKESESSTTSDESWEKEFDL